MDDSVAGVVLAAGAGSRLRPLSIERPKALCPFGTATLLDRVMGQLAPLTTSMAVNAQRSPEAVARAVGGRAHVSVERELLGTGGALGKLRDWIAGRPVLVANADTVHDADLRGFVEGWDGARTALFLAEPPATAFSSGVRVVAALMPWELVREIPAEPHGLYARWWAPAAARGALTAQTGYDGAWFDCGTPASYLAANLWWSGGRAVVGEGAVVDGEIDQAVVWPAATVSRGERLVRAIRTTRGRTVLVR